MQRERRPLTAPTGCPVAFVATKEPALQVSRWNPHAVIAQLAAGAAEGLNGPFAVDFVLVLSRIPQNNSH